MPYTLKSCKELAIVIANKNRYRNSFIPCCFGTMSEGLIKQKYFNRQFIFTNLYNLFLNIVYVKKSLICVYVILLRFRLHCQEKVF